VLEAAIMDGATGRAGAVCLLRTTRHPIGAARLVMEQTDHVLLAGCDAEQLARAHGLEQVDNSFFRTAHRTAALQRMLAGRDDEGLHHATVGAVACDCHGHLAVATSTGGITGKAPGRIGDTPMLGAGTWADGCVAVSCTGRGENFMRFVTARHIADRMAMTGESVEQASNAALQAMPDASGGLIAVDAHGTVAMPFTSAGMYRASLCDDGPEYVAIGP
jgi:isoaspartyl peptidase/L-asparaginase-like protein (Ntn-hydrolase superfamily)